MRPIPQNTTALPVISLAGLHLDTLGHYFAAIGLLRLASRQWPFVKGCWRDGVFQLTGGPKTFSELEAFIHGVGADSRWSEYTINRPASSPADSPEKKTNDLALWLANTTSETEASLALSHIAAGRSRTFNPVFGTGGNAGNRSFIKGWAKARDSVRAVTSKAKKRGRKIAASNEEASVLPAEMPAAARQDLSAFLNGSACSLLSDYGAACWFSDANKKYNFSPDSAFCEGQITPWAMLLACEAFPLLVGATSRQLGSAREGTGAFPFVTAGTAPENEKEVETLTGEFWAPVWNKPLSVTEVSALYKRGRAEVNGRGAITSAAFAAAIIQRGIDAGLAEFRRFSLLHTTSAQTFESRLASVHSLAAAHEDSQAQADAVSCMIRFRDALPREFKKGKSWVYRGLQGPIDTALVRLSASGNNNELLLENSWSLLDAVSASLNKTATNKAYREREPALKLLPIEWALSLLRNGLGFTAEMRIALALATLRAEIQKNESSSDAKRGRLAPFLAYRVGVAPLWKSKWDWVKIAKNTPLRVEWSERPITDNLVAIIRRRVAAEADTQSRPPFDTQLMLPISDVFAFLNNETDDLALTRWLNRFSLFDWSFLRTDERDNLAAILRSAPATSSGTINFSEAMLCFLRPLFHAYTFTQIQLELKSDKAPTTGMLRTLAGLLERGDIAAAFSAAQDRYKNLLIETANFGQTDFTLPHPRRLLAALLLPASPRAVASHFSRWQLPTRNKR